MKVTDVVALRPTGVFLPPEERDPGDEGYGYLYFQFKVDGDPASMDLRVKFDKEGIVIDAFSGDDHGPESLAGTTTAWYEDLVHEEEDNNVHSE